MLTAINRADVPDYIPGHTGRGRQPGWAMVTLIEFVNSDLEAAVVEQPGAKTHTSYVSLKKAQERKKFPVDICLRSGKIYIIRRENS